MSDRVLPRPLLLATLIACCVLISAASSLAPSEKPRLEVAPEWQRLAELWQTMVDHSSDRVYNPPAFRELARSFDSVDGDTAALVKRGLLPSAVALDLTHLFHSRYQYISERHYTTESQITLTATEAAAATAHWIIELQLAALRRAGAGPDVERKAMAQSQSPILYELSFLEECEKFQDEAERRRRGLADKQAAGENVDFKPFENERHRRTLLLLDAYQSKRIPISKSARALMPYIQSLTTLPVTSMQPSSPAAPGA